MGIEIDSHKVLNIMKKFFDCCFDKGESIPPFVNKNGVYYKVLGHTLTSSILDIDIYSLDVVAADEDEIITIKMMGS